MCLPFHLLPQPFGRFVAVSAADTKSVVIICAVYSIGTDRYRVISVKVLGY